MGDAFAIAVLAFAVSLDSFGVGTAYGLKRMRVPLTALLFIGCCSAFALFIAMLFGRFLVDWIQPHYLETSGGLLFILIGAWACYQASSQQKEEQEEEPVHEPEKRSSISLLFHTLSKPTDADLDQSGVIRGREALLLGSALSLDAFGAGIGAAFLGLPILPNAGLVALMSIFFLTLGLKSGIFLSKKPFIKNVSYLPGILLIVLGLWRL